MDVSQAQERLVPKAPSDEPKYPSGMRYLNIEDAPHPHTFTVMRSVQVGGGRVDLELFSAKGRDFVFRTDKRDKFPMKWSDLAHHTQVSLDRYLVHGRVEPFPHTDSQREQLAPYEFEGFSYSRIVRERGEEPVEKSLPFLLYTPEKAKDHRHREHIPLIVFLHGIGGRGEGNWKHFAKDGGGAENHFCKLVAKDWQRHMPCYVLVPQSNTTNNWWYKTYPALSPDAVTLTGNLIDYLAASEHPKIDLKRLYVTGFSGGGYGCYEFLRVFPGKFAATFPVAAYNEEIQLFSRYMAAPEWLIVNEHDPQISWRWVRWAGTLWDEWDVERRVKIYEGAFGHNTWSAAYGDPDFRRWLSKQELEHVSWPSDPSAVFRTDDELANDEQDK